MLRTESDTDSWSRFRPTADGHVSTEQLVFMNPGDAVFLVPLQVYPGEYRFSTQLTSFGLRSAMWVLGVSSFLERPWLGYGVGSFPVRAESMASEGAVPWQLTEFDHAHNEILTVAAERGILGLLALFAVYAAPFWLFLRRRDPFGYAGMAFVASIFLSGLTETIFNHSLGITYYSMMILILATAPREIASTTEQSR